MKQYCELCEKHCPVEDLGCGEGRRARAAEALLDEWDAGEIEPEAPRAEMNPEPRHPPRPLDGPEARPPHEGEGPEWHCPPHECGGPEGERPPHECDEPKACPPHECDEPEGNRPPWGPHHPPFPPREGQESYGPHYPPFPPREGPEPHDPHHPPFQSQEGLESHGPYHPPFPPHAGPEPHGPHHPPFPPQEGPDSYGPHHPPFPPQEGPEPHGPHHPPFPPHGGPGPRGPHPRPSIDPEELLRQAEDAPTLELFDICHRALHRPEAGAMRGQGRALAILAGRGEMSQRELQDMLRIAPGSMSELLAKLERKGMLTRARGDDRRSNLLKITEAGREAAAKITSPGDELLSALTEDQRTQFTATLKLLLADWLHRGDNTPSEQPERD